MAKVREKNKKEKERKENQRGEDEKATGTIGALETKIPKEQRSQRKPRSRHGC